MFCRWAEMGGERRGGLSGCVARRFRNKGERTHRSRECSRIVDGTLDVGCAPERKEVQRGEPPRSCRGRAPLTTLGRCSYSIELGSRLSSQCACCVRSSRPCMAQHRGRSFIDARASEPPRSGAHPVRRPSRRRRAATSRHCQTWMPAGSVQQC